MTAKSEVLCPFHNNFKTFFRYLWYVCFGFIGGFRNYYLSPIRDFGSIQFLMFFPAVMSSFFLGGGVFSAPKIQFHLVQANFDEFSRISPGPLWDRTERRAEVPFVNHGGPGVSMNLLSFSCYLLLHTHSETSWIGQKLPLLHLHLYRHSKSTNENTHMKVF